jgi:hypothetical protein
MVLAGTLAAVPAGGISPAEAQVSPNWTMVAGNFFGDARDEEFFYQPGTNPDLLISLSNGGVPGDPVSANFVDYTVNGTYRPVTGDFDGDNLDELFWYGPGGGADLIWHFADSRHFRQQAVSVSGTYTPLAGDFNGDGIDDVFWYGPGAAPDAMWLFLRGGGHVSVPVNITGTFRPFVASIGKDATDDIVWYRPGTGLDIVWDFTAFKRTHTQFFITVNGNYNPVALDSFGDGPRGDDIWWQAPGAASDPFWDYEDGVRVDGGAVLPVVTNWRVTVGDFFADGQEDTDMLTADLSREVLRDFSFVDGQFVFFDYTYSAQATAAAWSGDLDTKVSRAGAVQQHSR